MQLKKIYKSYGLSEVFALEPNMGLLLMDVLGGLLAAAYGDLMAQFAEQRLPIVVPIFVGAAEST